MGDENMKNQSKRDQDDDDNDSSSITYFQIVTIEWKIIIT